MAALTPNAEQILSILKDKKGYIRTYWSSGKTLHWREGNCVEHKRVLDRTFNQLYNGQHIKRLKIDDHDAKAAKEWSTRDREVWVYAQPGEVKQALLQQKTEREKWAAEQQAKKDQKFQEFVDRITEIAHEDAKRDDFAVASKIVKDIINAAINGELP